jgi:hypothetical protein
LQGLFKNWILKLFVRAGRVAQVVEHLPSKCDAPSSNPSTAKPNKTKNKEAKKSYL